MFVEEEILGDVGSCCWGGVAKRILLTCWTSRTAFPIPVYLFLQFDSPEFSLKLVHIPTLRIFRPRVLVNVRTIPRFCHMIRRNALLSLEKRTQEKLCHDYVISQSPSYGGVKLRKKHSHKKCEHCKTVMSLQGGAEH